MNLAGNAIKFTEKGEVLVEIDRQSEQNGNVELHFKVTDTGIGIPPEKHAILFQAFTQADSSTTRKYGGTGLGLAISARLIELMGGKIWLESTKARAAHFISPCATLSSRYRLSPPPPAWFPASGI